MQRKQSETETETENEERRGKVCMCGLWKQATTTKTVKNAYVA